MVKIKEEILKNDKELKNDPTDDSNMTVGGSDKYKYKNKNINSFKNDDNVLEECLEKNHDKILENNSKKNLKNIIICGPSGSGKTVAIKHILKTRKNFKLSTSYTTRKIRNGEVDGVNYFHVSKKRFEELIENKELCEYTTLNNEYYGTPMEYGIKSVLKNSEVMDGSHHSLNSTDSINIKSTGNERIFIYDIDYKGVKFFSKNCPNYKDKFYFWILTAPEEVIRERIVNRSSIGELELKNRLCLLKEYNELGKSFCFDEIFSNAGLVNEFIEKIDKKLDEYGYF